KDMLKASHRFNLSIDDDATSFAIPSADCDAQPGSVKSEIVEAILALTDPPRTPVYLSLYEGYTAPEIADMLEAPVNTVYSWISRGKQQLKEALA
ncbi:MAG: RNA polymerase sigma factor, partial [Raoultibacter sp.]